MTKPHLPPVHPTHSALSNVGFTKQLRLFAGALLALPVLVSSAQAAWTVRQVPLNISSNTANDGGGVAGDQLENITEGEDLLAGSNSFVQGAPIGTGTPAVINYARGGSGDFTPDLNFPTGDGSTDQNDFALDAVGLFVYNTAGTYVFRVNTDDGFRLRLGVTPTGSGSTISATGGSTYSEFISPRGPANTDGAGIVRSAGFNESARLTFFERAGGEEVELSYSLNGGSFQLVGQGSDITVVTVPEPGAACLLGLVGAGLLARRRRVAQSA